MINSAVLTTTSGGATPILFDTDIFDRWGMHSTSSQTDRLVVQVPGIYYVQANVEWAANTVGARGLTVYQRAAGGGGKKNLGTTQVSASQSLTTNISVSGASLVAETGEWFTAEAYQNSGGNLNISAATSNLWHKHGMNVVWISRG